MWNIINTIIDTILKHLISTETIILGVIVLVIAHVFFKSPLARQLVVRKHGVGELILT